MAQRIYIIREEKSMPGHTPMKDSFTLFLCGNAFSDCKIKPLPVDLLENSRAFKANNVMISKLPVILRSNTKALLIRQYFIEWVQEVFAQAMKKYLEKKKLQLCYLLVRDNAPSYPPGLENDLTDEFHFIRFKFLPPNMKPLLQPMGFENVASTSVAADVEEESQEKRQFIDYIIILGQNLGLEMNSNDVQEVLDEHRAYLTTEELLPLQEEQKKTLEEEMSSDEDEGRKDDPTAVIRDICAKWKKLQNLMELYY
ncbi:tigger transposable element-derived protein 1-like [Palaemon carinicauda]|uniref:tigger transposable element-derived protein 1-like n=1 Tax=Palaemon carinicauda TaxID=392227 RepID=UPI0035B63E22